MGQLVVALVVVSSVVELVVALVVSLVVALVVALVVVEVRGQWSFWLNFGFLADTQTFAFAFWPILAANGCLGVLFCGCFWGQ